MGHSSHFPEAYHPEDDEVLYLAQLAAEDADAERMYQRWCAEEEEGARYRAQLAAEAADAARDADGPPIASAHDVF